MWGTHFDKMIGVRFQSRYRSNIDAINEHLTVSRSINKTSIFWLIPHNRVILPPRCEYTCSCIQWRSHESKSPDSRKIRWHPAQRQANPYLQRAATLNAPLSVTYRISYWDNRILTSQSFSCFPLTIASFGKCIYILSSKWDTSFILRSKSWWRAIRAVKRKIRSSERWLYYINLPWLLHGLSIGLTRRVTCFVCTSLGVVSWYSRIASRGDERNLGAKSTNPTIERKNSLDRFRATHATRCNTLPPVSVALVSLRWLLALLFSRSLSHYSPFRSSS